MAQLNLNLAPAQLEFVVRPGTAFIQTYDVQNLSSQAVLLTTSVSPWQPLGTDGSVTYQNIPPNPHYQFSLSNADLKLGQTFLLRANEKKQLVLKIKSDVQTPLADSYFTFFVSQDLSGSLNPDSSRSAVTGRLGSHLLISASNTENPPAVITQSALQSFPRLLDIFLTPVHFQGLITNSGGYFSAPTGRLTITKNGLEIKKLELFPQNVLSHHSRDIRCQANNLPTPCSFSPPFWPGLYTATLTLDPPTGGPASSPSASPTTFFVFPFSPLAIVLLALIIYLPLRSVVVRQSKHKKP